MRRGLFIKGTIGVWLLSLLLGMGGSAGAAVSLTAEQEQQVKQVEAYLNGVTTVVAHFSQVAPDGKQAEGTFYLKRPGRIRWQYDPPTPVIIVGRDRNVMYYDYDLKEVSYVSLDDELALFLTDRQIDFFRKGLQIDQVEVKGGLLRISLSRPEKPEEGALTLVMQQSPITLAGLEITDVNGQTTYVSFTEHRYGIDLQEDLFRTPKVKKKTL